MLSVRWRAVLEDAACYTLRIACIWKKCLRMIERKVQKRKAQGVRSNVLQ